LLIFTTYFEIIRVYCLNNHPVCNNIVNTQTILLFRDFLLDLQRDMQFIRCIIKAHTKDSRAVTKENRIEYRFLFNLIRIHPIRILPTSKGKFSIKRNQYPMPLTALLSPRRSRFNP